MARWIFSTYLRNIKWRMDSPNPLLERSLRLFGRQLGWNRIRECGSIRLWELTLPKGGVRRLADLQFSHLVKETYLYFLLLFVLLEFKIIRVVPFFHRPVFFPLGFGCGLLKVPATVPVGVISLLYVYIAFGSRVSRCRRPCLCGSVRIKLRLLHVVRLCAAEPHVGA